MTAQTVFHIVTLKVKIIVQFKKFFLQINMCTNAYNEKN